jgi:hypothetical protein
MGRPIELSGWSDKVDTPQFATGVGLLRFALRQPGTLGNPLATSSNPQLAPAMADPGRRVWGVRAPSSPHNGALHEDQPLAEELMAMPGGTSTQGHARPVAGNATAAQNGTDAVSFEEDEAAPPVEYKTPFDRMRRDRRGQVQKLRSTDNEETQTLWQRVVAGVRQFLGFETV